MTPMRTSQVQAAGCQRGAAGATPGCGLPGLSERNTPSDQPDPNQPSLPPSVDVLSKMH